jgi:hypothetical protein
VADMVVEGALVEAGAAASVDLEAAVPAAVGPQAVGSLV